jgi:hypothetical protein
MSGTGRRPTTRLRRPRKRPATASPPSAGSPGEADDFWAVKDIKNEKIERGRVLYLIEWEGTNPDTGRAWEPTWVWIMSFVNAGRRRMVGEFADRNRNLPKTSQSRRSRTGRPRSNYERSATTRAINRIASPYGLRLGGHRDQLDPAQSDRASHLRLTRRMRLCSDNSSPVVVVDEVHRHKRARRSRRAIGLPWIARLVRKATS